MSAETTPMAPAETTPMAPAETTRESFCMVCLDSEGLFPLPCPDHAICMDCIKERFELALLTKTNWPPMCCAADNALPMSVYEPLFDAEFIEDYNAKEQEYETKDPLYCANRACSVFLHPTTWTVDREEGSLHQGHIARCTRCLELTCPRCSNTIDRSTIEQHHCNHEPEDAQAVIGVKSIKPCPNCRVVIEHIDACNHLTCDQCKAQFCFICTAPYPCENRCPPYRLPEVDQEGYTLDWDSPEGFRPGGFHKDTGFNRAGYDRRGFNKDGFSGTGKHVDDARYASWNEGAVEDVHENLDDDHLHLDQWRQTRELDDIGLDWAILEPGAREEHEMAQMRIDFTRGLFIPDDPPDHAVQHLAAMEWENDDATHHHDGHLPVEPDAVEPDVDEPGLELHELDQLAPVDNAVPTLAPTALDADIVDVHDLAATTVNATVDGMADETESGINADGLINAPQIETADIQGEPVQDVYTIVTQRLREYIASGHGHGRERGPAHIGRRGGFIFDHRGQ